VGTVEDSSALLSLRNLKRLLTEQKSSLVALDLSRTSITPESLRTIAQVSKVYNNELRKYQSQLINQLIFVGLYRHEILL